MQRPAFNCSVAIPICYQTYSGLYVEIGEAQLGRYKAYKYAHMLEIADCSVTFTHATARSLAPPKLSRDVCLLYFLITYARNQVPQ